MTPAQAVLEDALLEMGLDRRLLAFTVEEQWRLMRDHTSLADAPGYKQLYQRLFNHIVLLDPDWAAAQVEIDHERAFREPQNSGLPF